MNSQFALLRASRFSPLFILQFLGAFNDNLAKTAFAVLIAYGLWDVRGFDPAVLVSAAAGIFIIPFILCCPFAGRLADRYDKASIIRWTKLAEIVIALCGAFVFLTESFYLAFFVLFALGVQSAFFSPCKFSILPQHLKPDELIGGNALISMGTYIAILAGTIGGSFLAPLDSGEMIVSAVLIICALSGYMAARFVPDAPPPANRASLSIVSSFSSFISMGRIFFAQKSVTIIAVLGIAWFYFFAATLHAQFPNFTKQILGADHIVLIVFMTLFAIGVAIGGLLNNKVLKSKVDARLVPLAAFCMAGFATDVYFASQSFTLLPGGGLYDVQAFVAQPGAMRILVDLFLLSVACGFYVVPLRAIVQLCVSEDERGRVMSASNVMDAVFILGSAVLGMVLLGYGFDVVELYLAVSVMTFFVAAFLFIAGPLRAMSAGSLTKD